MTPTNCPNCGAGITAENSGDFCMYCGTRLPKPEQNIINNNEYHTHNHVHNHNVTKVYKRYGNTMDTSEQQKRPNILGIFVSLLMLFGVIILAIAFQTPVFLILLIWVGIYFFWHKDQTNYCPHCFYPKSFTASVCTHCKLNVYKSAKSQYDEEKKRNKKGPGFMSVIGWLIFIGLFIYIFYLQ